MIVHIFPQWWISYSWGMATQFFCPFAHPLWRNGWFIKLSASTLVKIWCKSHANFVKSLWWGNYIQPWPTPIWSTPHQFWKISTMENRPLPTFSDVLNTTGSIQLPPHPAKNSPKWPQGMLKYKGRKSKPEQTAFVESTLKIKVMVGCLNWVNRPVSLVVILTHKYRQIATCLPIVEDNSRWHGPIIRLSSRGRVRSKSSILSNTGSPRRNESRSDPPAVAPGWGWLTARLWWGKNLDVPKKS